jgi:outer membrane protein assembly factor BamB
MSGTHASLTLTLCLLLLATGAAGAADAPLWPQFHGPNRDNISAETGLLKAWPEGGPKLLWTAKGLGHGYSTVSTAGGILYTAGNIGKDTVVTALDLNGKTLWQVKNGPAWSKSYPGTRGTPTIDGDRVYHQSPLGSLVCLDARTGKTLWQANTLEQFKSKTSNWALAESLLIDGDRVISCPGGPETCMVALNKKTGKLVWKAPSTGDLAGYCSPILVEHKGLRIIIALTATNIVGVNADTGELLWRDNHVSFANENVMTPIFHEGHVFISTLMAGSVKWKLVVEDSKARLEEVWRTKHLDNHHGGVVLVNGALYGTSVFRNRNLWVCLDWKTGEPRSMQKGIGKGAPVVVGGMLYMLSIDRKVGLARPTETGFELVSAFEIPEGGKGKSWAHPVVCGGRMYLRHGDFLYVYDVAGKGE